MKTILRVRNVVKEWNGIPLFENISLEVTEGKRLALFGRNGAGKTTLLRILNGDEAPTSGQVEHDLPLEERGWLKQQDTVNLSRTALEAAQQASPQHWHLKQALGQLKADLADAGKDAEHHLERYGELRDEYERLQGFAWESEVEKALTRMGMPAETWSIAYGDLSGGQKTRVRLAGLMVSQPKLLVLDEPTNHLDAETREIVEDSLRSYDGALVLVSHDRELVRSVANRLLDMKPGGGYELYQGTADEKQEDERSRQREPEDQEQREERLRLQLRLTELMGMTGIMDGNDEHLSEIRRIRARLDRLDFSSIHKNEV